MVSLEDAAVSALLVLVGFFLSAGWERYRDKHQERDQRERIRTSVFTDVAMNNGSCKALMKDIEKGLLLKFGALPPSFSTYGWTMSISNWKLLEFDAKTIALIAKSYQIVETINHVIRSQQEYQMNIIGVQPLGNISHDQRNILAGYQESLRDLCQKYFQVFEKLLEVAKLKVRIAEDLFPDS